MEPSDDSEWNEDEVYDMHISRQMEDFYISTGDRQVNQVIQYLYIHGNRSKHSEHIRACDKH